MDLTSGPPRLRLAVRLGARLLLAVVLGAALSITAVVALGASLTFTVVASGSMAPTLSAGDVVLLRETPASGVRPGQVLAVRDPARAGTVLLHRLVDVDPDGGLRTRGDANAAEDSTPVRPSAVIGVAVLHVPTLGLPVVWADNGQLPRLALLAIAVLLLVGAALAPLDDRPRRHRWPARLLAPVVAATVLAGALPVGLASATFSATTANTGSSFAAAATFPTYPQTVLGDSPAVYYRSADANGSTSAVDSSPNGTNGVYVGTAASFKQPGGPAGGSSTADESVLFPGTVGATAYAPNTSIAGPQVFTAEVWFKTTSTTAGRLLGFGQSQTADSFNNDRNIALSAGGALSFYVNNATSTTITSAGGYNDGAWHHVAATLGPAGMRLYADGSQVASNASVTTAQSYSGFWRLGGDTGVYFKGHLDEAAVYSTQLSATRVAAHRNTGRTATTLAQYTSEVSTDSPWGLWHLDDPPESLYYADDVTTTMSDSSGQGHGGVYTVRPQSVVGGVSGAMKGVQTPDNAVRFGSAGVGYDPLLTAAPTTFSLELWFRTTTTNGGQLLGMGDSQSGSSDDHDRKIYMRNSGRLNVGIYNGTAVTVASSSLSYNDGAWHHVVATATPSTLLLYVDGSLAGTNSSPGTAHAFSGYWRWGGDNVGSWPNTPTADFFTGDLDEIAVYPTALTAQQVGWHYHANH